MFFHNYGDDLSEQRPLYIYTSILQGVYSTHVKGYSLLDLKNKMFYELQRLPIQYWDYFLRS
jgi:hypothetical protein